MNEKNTNTLTSHKYLCLKLRIPFPTLKYIEYCVNKLYEILFERKNEHFLEVGEIGI